MKEAKSVFKKIMYILILPVLLGAAAAIVNKIDDTKTSMVKNVDVFLYTKAIDMRVSYNDFEGAATNAPVSMKELKSAYENFVDILSVFQTYYGANDNYGKLQQLTYLMTAIQTDYKTVTQSGVLINSAVLPAVESFIAGEISRAAARPLPASGISKIVTLTSLVVSLIAFLAIIVVLSFEVSGLYVRGELLRVAMQLAGFIIAGTELKDRRKKVRRRN